MIFLLHRIVDWGHLVVSRETGSGLGVQYSRMHKAGTLMETAGNLDLASPSSSHDCRNSSCGFFSRTDFLHGSSGLQTPQMEASSLTKGEAQSRRSITAVIT